MEEQVQTSPEQILDSLETTENVSTETQPVQQQTISDVIKYTVDGREIEEPLDMVKKRASFGYHASQRLEEANKRFEESQRLREEAEQVQGKWKQFDDYARENPKWMEHVLDQWNKRDQVAVDIDPNDPAAKLYDTMNQKLSALEQEQKKALEYINQEKKKTEDQNYKTDFESVIKSYPNVDFVKPDESGKSLEYRVLEFATENGIKNFKTAFKAYYHDQLVEMGKTQAKEEITKKMQEDRSRGIIGRTNSPTKQNSKDFRGLSTSQVAEMALNDETIWKTN